MKGQNWESPAVEAYPEGRVLLLGEGSRDEMQVSGAWMRMDRPVELRP